MEGSKEKLAPGRRLVADLSRVLCAIAEGRRTAAEVAKDLQKIAARLLASVPEKPAKAAAPARDTRADEEAIFAYWVVAADKRTAKFTPERRAKVKARLRDGYTVAQIKHAIDFVCSDPFHIGENENHKTYTDLELICRNATKLEQFIERAGDLPTSHTTSPEGRDEHLEKLRDEARIALEKGDTDAYNRAQKAIRTARTG